MSETNNKMLYAYINAENEVKANVIKLAAEYEVNGADGLYIYNHSADNTEKEEFFSIIKELIKLVDLPVLVGCRADCFDDAKHAYYTGASGIVIAEASLIKEDIIKACASRFGSSNVYLEVNAGEEGFYERLIELENKYTTGYMLKHAELTGRIEAWMSQTQKKIFIRDSLVRNSLEALLKLENLIAVATNHYEDKDIIKAKKAMALEGINMNMYDSSMRFEEFKFGENALIPVIVQDYITDEVLMLAYMNKESYEATVNTGKMTYFSRSRQKLWLKGETSGHYQYVRELRIDCDNDTILAKVKQIGAACHTGERSCFYRTILKRSSGRENVLNILNEVYNTIKDRKENPKEGSYTNYLFDKGLDKILKKCGEEATEIVIAAKNQEGEELKYEIADYLYHLMVLMAEKGVDWEDITTELSHRH